MIETEDIVGTGVKISVSKDELVQALGVVSRAVSTRTSVQIDGDGAIVLPGKTLVDIARLLPADEVTIEHRAAESVVHVVSGSASYTLHTYNPEDFPRLPDVGAIQTFAVDRESLLETITRVARAASRDEARPVLTGVLVQFTEGKLVMAP